MNPNTVFLLGLFEAGVMDSKATVAFVQQLVDEGVLCQLDAAYGRLAHRLTELGYVQTKQAH